MPFLVRKWPLRDVHRMIAYYFAKVLIGVNPGVLMERNRISNNCENVRLVERLDGAIYIKQRFFDKKQSG